VLPCAGGAVDVWVAEPVPVVADPVPVVPEPVPVAPVPLVAVDWLGRCWVPWFAWLLWLLWLL
jgi:hypothetical protein